MHWLATALLLSFAGVVALAWALHPLAGLLVLLLGPAAAFGLLHLLPRGGIALRLRQRRGRDRDPQ